MSTRIDALTKRYGGILALEDVTFQVPPAGRIAVLGPEDAGKTTLARILAGLEPPSAGTVHLDDLDLGENPRAARRVGYVPAEPGLEPDRTPRELLRFAGRLHGLEPSEVERRLEQLLIDVHLEHLGGHAIRHLETGMRRRLALAYALVPDPLLVVVDEPTQGLGPQASNQVREAIERFTRETGLLVASSQPADAERLCDTVVGLEDGRIVVEGGIDEFTGEQGLAVQITLAGRLSTAALDELREHPAVGALRRQTDDEDPRLEVWITDPDRLPAVLATLVDAGAPVASFTPLATDLGEVLSEHMEASL